MRGHFARKLGRKTRRNQRLALDRFAGKRVRFALGKQFESRVVGWAEPTVRPLQMHVADPPRRLGRVFMTLQITHVWVLTE